MELLDLLASHRAVPIEQLAARFFSVNPFSKAVNTNPLGACEQRLSRLARAGLILRYPTNDGQRARTLIALGPKASSIIGAEARRRVPARKLAHHARTLDALVVVEKAVERRGGRVLSKKIEQQVRSEAQRGRFLQSGDAFEPFPDAVCSVAATSARSGRARTLLIAVEYATSKYTDADIRRKHESFKDHYDRVVWFADRASTKRRIERITQRRCFILL